MVLDKYLDQMIEQNASDMFMRVNSPVRYRLKGQVIKLDENKLTLEDIEAICFEMMDEWISPEKNVHLSTKPLTDEDKQEIFRRLHEMKNYEGGFFYRDSWRFRAGVFYQRNSLAIVIRKIDLRLKTFEDYDLPSEVLQKLAQEKRGLILLTGITGSGKSTTIAALIEYINERLNRHILSIEEPIEFTFTDKESIINQREIGKDVFSYSEALKQFAMLSPDVIYIGQIRDEDTMRAALTAAETGALVLSTIHSLNAPQTVERIMNFFPPHEHDQVRKQLSMLLKGVISMRLVSKADGSGVIPAYEVMTGCPTITRLIRENNIWDISRYIEEGDIYGMVSFEQTFMRLVKDNIIHPQTAIDFSDKPEELLLRMRQELEISEDVRVKDSAKLQKKDNQDRGHRKEHRSESVKKEAPSAHDEPQASDDDFRIGRF